MPRITFKGLDEKKCTTEFTWLRLRSANVGWAKSKPQVL